MEEEKFFGGFPDRRGWYDCMIDGERVRLLHFICQMSNRHEWVTASGDYVTGDGVTWSGPAEAPVV